MKTLRKVLVVDDGSRNPADALSSELAELGFASVTTSVDALDDVLAVISPPAAILIHLPEVRRGSRQRFIDVAERLQGSGIPVAVVDRSLPGGSGGAAPALRTGFGAPLLNEPDL